MGLEKDIKQQNFSSNFHKAMLNVYYTSNWFYDQVKDIMKQFDITSQQFNVLRILKGRYPDACAASDVKEVMLDKSPDLTRLFDRLVDKGLITRETCVENRRKLDVRISKKGIELLEKINPLLDAHQSAMKNRITDKEAVEVSRILDKLRE